MSEHESIRQLLCDLGDIIQQAMAEARGASDLHKVARETEADTIYQIDAVIEDVVLEWFEARWPSELPVRVVMEGIEDREVVYPIGSESTEWVCIIDPIDGTRGIMYDMRPAWALAAVAPDRGADTRLGDVVASAMTELPTSKQWRADQVSAVVGGGLVATSRDIRDGSVSPLELRPSGATDFRHGFAWFVRYFPEGKELTARIEEQLWEQLVGLGKDPSPTVFEDQYISCGGVFYEVLAGHYRMFGDLRPMVHRKLGIESTLACHHYDVCPAMLLVEAGVIIEDPETGEYPDCPLDTTTPVGLMIYANAELAALARPVLGPLLKTHLSP